MAKTFDKKIRELQERKSELNLSFLQKEKEEYQQRLDELLETPINEGDEKNALNEARAYHTKIKEINHKIQHLPEDIENINKKILFLQERKEIPLYRETREGIAEIFGRDIVKYAEESNNEELINKLKTRTLTLEEYIGFLDKEYSEFLDIDCDEDLIKKRKERETMYVKLFTPRLNKLDKLDKKSSNKNNNVQQTPKISIILPEGMLEQIYEDLRNNRDIRPQVMAKFLKNELKKNAGEISLSHIRSIFADNNYNQAYEYIKKLIINYQGFKLEDEVEEKIEDNISEKNGKPKSSVLDVSSEESEKYKEERLRQNSLSDKLNEIKKIENLKTRISKYLDLFEELDNVSVDRKDFEPRVYEVITRYTHIEIEKDIIKTLNQLIQGKPCMERIGLYKYNVYKFNRDSWRMLAYPNGELFTICPHEEYERIINTQPPANKTE